MKSTPLILLALFAVASTVHAATVSDENIFNDGTTQATVDSTTLYGGFSQAGIDDLNGDSQFFFADAANGTPQILSLSGFDATAGIGSLRFYGEQEYEIRRVPLTVTIYTSLSSLSGTASLTESNYSLLGTFALPATLDVPDNHAYYTSGTDSTGGDGNYGKYDELDNLGIVAGTQSILFDFGGETSGGEGMSEIQGFVEAPEPSSYSMLVAGLILFGLLASRKLAPGAMLKS